MRRWLSTALKTKVLHLGWVLITCAQHAVSTAINGAKTALCVELSLYIYSGDYIGEDEIFIWKDANSYLQSVGFSFFANSNMPAIHVQCTYSFTTAYSVSMTIYRVWSTPIDLKCGVHACHGLGHQSVQWYIILVYHKQKSTTVIGNIKKGSSVFS